MLIWIIACLVAWGAAAVGTVTLFSVWPEDRNWAWWLCLVLALIIVLLAISVSRNAYEEWRVLKRKRQVP